MEEKGLGYQKKVLVVYISSIWTPLWYTCLHFDKETVSYRIKRYPKWNIFKISLFSCVKRCKENTNWNENVEALQIILTYQRYSSKNRLTDLYRSNKNSKRILWTDWGEYTIG